MAIDFTLAVPSVWKPWTPKIGQRVRIRVSEECTALRAAADEKETLTRYHSRSETGMVGVVVQPTPGVWMPREGLEGHDIMVSFDPGSVHFQGCISFSALYFAAEELEPAPDGAHLGDRVADQDDVADADEFALPTASAQPARKPNRTRRERRDARRRSRQLGQASAR